MVDKEERMKHLEDMESKLWFGDLTSLTSQEIKDIFTNFLYQTFLIDMTSFHFAFKSDETGTYIKVIIDGLAYKDPSNISISDLLGEEEENIIIDLEGEGE